MPRGKSCSAANDTFNVVEAPTVVLSGVKTYLFIVPRLATMRISSELVSYSLDEDRIEKMLDGFSEIGLLIALPILNSNCSSASIS